MICIDDVLIYGKSEAEILRNVRRVFERLRAKNVAVNLKKTKLKLNTSCHFVHPRVAIEGP